MASGTGHRVIASNHGGWQWDGAAVPIDLLPKIAQAVGHQGVRYYGRQADRPLALLHAPFAKVEFVPRRHRARGHFSTEVSLLSRLRNTCFTVTSSQGRMPRAADWGKDPSGNTGTVYRFRQRSLTKGDRSKSVYCPRISLSPYFPVPVFPGAGISTGRNPRS
ncbi:MAG: hypothetical protein HYY36_02255 [Gammaproteobacteria bacterium]|nr:hypothetical protein [Gammaproteobacteria bacterium]